MVHKDLHDNASYKSNKVNNKIIACRQRININKKIATALINIQYQWKQGNKTSARTKNKSVLNQTI